MTTARMRVLISLVTFSVAVMATVRADAADLFWFGNGATLGGSGNWSAAGTNWSTTSPALTATIWNPSRRAVFQAPAGTATITDMNLNAAAGLRFETTGYTVAGNAMTVTLTLTGGDPPTNSLDVGGTDTATATVRVAGTNGLAKIGSGTFALSAANTYTGETWIEGGTLSVPGSIVPMSNLFVGYNNSGTTLSIPASGSVSDTSAYLGNLPTSASNTATVSGMGAMWTNATDLVIGHQGGSNALTASAGGAVSTTNGFLGYFATSAGNSVLITGAGSTWSNSNVLEIGHEGGSNTFTVTSGGSALSSKDTVLGFLAASGSNGLKVQDLNSKFEVANGFTLVIGDNGDANTLEILGDGLVMGHNARLARSASSANNSVTVSGGGARWINTGTLRVGNLGGGNSVTVSGGGEVSFAGNQFIGHGAAAVNNTVKVTGLGSKWTGGNLVVGLASTGNVFTVSDSATFTSPGVAIANDAGSGGTVNIGEGGAAGAFIAPIQFGAGTGILNFNHSDPNYSFNNAIIGTGSVRHIGTGTTTLGGPSLYDGGTTISAGRLRAGAANALPSSGPVILNGGILDANNFSLNLGELTLLSTSTLAFGAGGSGQTVVFASAAPWVGGTLLVTGVNFAIDELIITADPTASGVLDHIQFEGYPVGAIWNPTTGVVLPRFAALSTPAPALSPMATILALLVLIALAARSLLRSE